MIADAIICGPDLDRHRAQIAKFERAGFDELYVNQIGPDQRGFFDFYADLLPRLRELG